MCVLISPCGGYVWQTRLMHPTQESPVSYLSDCFVRCQKQVDLETMLVRPFAFHSRGLCFFRNSGGTAAVLGIPLVPWLLLLLLTMMME